MLAPHGDRAVPALTFLLLPNLSSVFFYHLDACSKWRQGGARITEFSDLSINEMYGYGTG